MTSKPKLLISLRRLAAELEVSESFARRRVRSGAWVPEYELASLYGWTPEKLAEIRTVLSLAKIPNIES